MRGAEEPSFVLFGQMERGREGKRGWRQERGRREGETERGEKRKERRDGQGVKPPKKDSPNKDTSSAPTNHYNDP